MARYEIQPWVSTPYGSWVIRDTEQDVYIRDWQGNVSALTLGAQIERCYRMNQLNAERVAESAQSEYEALWDQRERDWEAYSDAMGDDPMEYVDTDDYAYQCSYR